MNRILYILTFWITTLLISSCSNYNSTDNQEQNTEPELLDTPEKYTADWKSLSKHQSCPDWFADSKLGIYFHWGIYSVPAWGSEWYPRWMYVPDREGWGEEIYEYHRATYGSDFQYHDFIPKWKGEKFNAAEWVDLFANSGARIIGSIAEHHDGFSLWDSQVNEWNSAQMGPKINVVEAIYKETKKRNLKFMATFHHGFHLMFYPKQENTWRRPVSKYTFVQDSCEVPQDPKYAKLYGNLEWEEANTLWLGKVNEVIDQYTPDYIWMDFGQRFVGESYRKQFLSHYFNQADQKGLEVVVNRKGDFFPADLSIVNVERATMSDIQPEVWVTDFILGSSWCYNREKRTAIDPAIAIRTLADVVSKNGVMLLSAGPKPDGTIPEEQVETLTTMGKWLKLYGEAIYDTRPHSTYGEGPTLLQNDDSDAFKEYGALKLGFNELNHNDIRYTRKGNTVYAIQLGWNSKDSSVRLSKLITQQSSMKVKEITVLGSKEKVQFEQSQNGLTLMKPKQKPEHAEIATVYKIEVE